LEHLNKEAKKSIAGLGSNITNESILRIGKSIGNIVNILKNFDKINDIKESSSHHIRRSCEKDLKIIIKQLMEVNKVFVQVPLRTHMYFPKVKANSVKHISIKNLTEWMKQQLMKITM